MCIVSLNLKYISIFIQIHLENWKNIYILLKDHLNSNTLSVTINRCVLGIMKECLLFSLFLAALAIDKIFL